MPQECYLSSPQWFIRTTGLAVPPMIASAGTDERGVRHERDGNAISFAVVVCRRDAGRDFRRGERRSDAATRQGHSTWRRGVFVARSAHRRRDKAVFHRRRWGSRPGDVGERRKRGGDGPLE